MDRALISDIGFTKRKEFDLILDRFNLKLGPTTKIMGILNVTPDSFSQDGIYKDPERAKDLALKMVDDGAEIIDVGGESTRPVAQPVNMEEEKQRVLPVIRKLSKEIKVPISIDTSKSEVARAAIGEGASIINDISGLQFDAQMPQVIARSQAGCILMHIQGTPQTMQQNPVYTELIEEIIESLKVSLAKASSAGIDKNKIIIDPGIGFGKTTEHNLKIIKRLKSFSVLNFPILIGTSRKSFIGNVLSTFAAHKPSPSGLGKEAPLSIPSLALGIFGEDTEAKPKYNLERSRRIDSSASLTINPERSRRVDLPVDRRLFGTAASVAASILNGAHIIRVHDVKEMTQVARMVDAILMV